MHYQVPTTVTEIKLTYQSKVKASDRPQIKSSQEAYELFQHYWSDQIGLVEEFMIILLDRSNRAMAVYPVSVGGLAGTVVDPKIVFAAALKGRASSMILAHNHPSGALKPSQADINITNKLRQAGELLDLPIIDHLILSPDGGHLSFADEGLL